MSDMDKTVCIVDAGSDDENRRKNEDWLAQCIERQEKLLKKARENPRVLTPEIEAEVDAKVRAKIGEGGHMGYCHWFWSCKKEILREKYDIEWLSPAETNLGCMFD